MGKWIFITILLAVFCDLSAGSNDMPIGARAVVMTGTPSQVSHGIGLHGVSRFADQVSHGIGLHGVSRFADQVSRTIGLPGASAVPDHASFSTATRTSPFPRLLCGHLVLPEAGCHAAQSQIIQPQFHLNTMAWNDRFIREKQSAPAEPVLKDHFHHLFPFFHFW